MTPKKAQHQSVIDGPRESGKFTLYPVTFGLLEWLQSTRKNPLIVGGEAEVKHAVELCYAFTRPAAEICRVQNAKVAKLVSDFSNELTPAEFHRIQKHAQDELMKFGQTSAVPKKKPTPPRQKVKR